MSTWDGPRGFNRIPIYMHREVFEKHLATEGFATQLNPASYFDPEDISSIPEYMHQEVISQ